MRKVFLTSTKRDSVVGVEIPDNIVNFGDFMRYLKERASEYSIDVTSGKLAYFLDKRDGSTAVRMTVDTVFPEEGSFFVNEVVNKASAGAELTRSELGALIKQASTDPVVKAKFIIDGKNWTQLSTAVLQELWAAHIGSGTTGTSKTSTTTSNKVPAVKTIKEVAKTVTTATPKIEIITGEEALTMKKDAMDNIILSGHDLKKR